MDLNGLQYQGRSDFGGSIDSSINSQNDFAESNSHGFQDSPSLNANGSVSNRWMSLAGSEWSATRNQSDAYPITPLNSPLFTPRNNSWSRFDESFKNALPTNDMLSPTCDTSVDGMGSFQHAGTTSSINPTWNLQNSVQPATTAYLPMSVMQNNVVVIDLEFDCGEFMSGPLSSLIVDSTSELSPVIGPNATPKRGISKSSKKTHGISGSSDTSRYKSGKKQHRRNSSHSSTAPHQLRSIKNAGKSTHSASEQLSGSQLSCSRISHNLVEKQYRDRLNNQFNTLLSSIPSEVVESEVSGYSRSEGRERKVSKAEVLMLAKMHIETLEKTKHGLETQKEQLKGNVQRLKDVWVTMGGEILP